jgi:virginiamycin B lyase
MRMSGWSLALALALSSMIECAAVATELPFALAGSVSSPEEGPMEGVVVTLKKPGSTIALSVVSGAEGRYAFPADRLEPGRYAIAIRAVGYDLNGPIAAQIAEGKPAIADLKLGPTRDISRQLTNAEWLMSIPASDEQRAGLLNCVSCHTLDVIMRSTENSDEFLHVFTRMASYAKGSMPLHPQWRRDSIFGENADRFRPQADFLAAINLGKLPRWDYKLETLPRVTGRGTRVLITQYDLPRRTMEPHDVIAAGGFVYFSNFGEQSFGRLDPASGMVKEYDLPLLKQGYPTGTLDLERDADGKFWIGMMYQGAVARFDPQAERAEIFRLPPQLDSDVAELRMVTRTSRRDGSLWTNDAGAGAVYRLDPASGAYQAFDPLRGLPGGKLGHRIYDMATDSQDNLYMTDFQENYLLRRDGETGSVTAYRTPTAEARNRRGRMDEEDHFFFAEFLGNRLGMLDTRSGEIGEWKLPTPWSAPYDAAPDRHGNLWTASMTTDRIIRIDRATGAATEYPLPRPTNMRRIFDEGAASAPSLWVASTHGASILHIEPLD